MGNELNEFWGEVERQFHPMLRVEAPTYVLSPGQLRKYKLAHLKVPKFAHLIERPDPHYRFCVVNKSLFESKFEELHALGLLRSEDLEARYCLPLVPEFMGFSGSWDDLIKELSQLIGQRKANERFAKLWAIYLKRNLIMLFLEYFDPYVAAAKSVEGNDSSEMDKYIYAIWMHSFGYKGGKGKDPLLTRLAAQLDEILESRRAKSAERPWYFTYFESLRAVKSGESLIIRTVTDMTPDKIKEYAEDGAFTRMDFPELFSVT